MAFSHISLNSYQFKFKKIVSIILISLVLLITFKYHLRFNENRKFHELENVELKLSINAKEIHKKLSGLNWITPQFKNNPMEEINIINQIISVLGKDTRNQMLITNYAFVSIILNRKLYSPSRVYIGDGTVNPLKGNKYATKYKELMDSIILKNDISVIYVINTDNENINFHYLDSYQNCLIETSLLDKLKSYELKNCNG